MFYAKSLQKLIDELNKLPGVGPKTAQRLAFHILRISETDAKSLAQAIIEMRERIKSCSICNNLTETDPCLICQDKNRLQSTICVVEEPDDLVVLERTKQYKGLYHILCGAISPLEGVNPEDLKIDGLLERIKKGKIEEVIFATNPNTEGDRKSTRLNSVTVPSRMPSSA